MRRRWDALTLAYDGLLGYRRQPGPAGEALVGALATAVPEPIDGGRTYVFTLRPGIRFSDGRPVRAGRRPRVARARGPAERATTLPGFYASILGAAALRASRRAAATSRARSSPTSARGR